MCWAGGAAVGVGAGGWPAVRRAPHPSPPRCRAGSMTSKGQELGMPPCALAAVVVVMLVRQLPLLLILLLLLLAVAVAAVGDSPPGSE